MAAELALLRETRREQDKARRDHRSLVDLMQSLTNVVNRQSSRLERTISDLRDDLESMVKMDVAGRFAGAESRIERREAAELTEMRRQIAELTDEVATMKAGERAE